MKKIIILLSFFLLVFAPSALAIPQLQEQTIAGITLRSPKGWEIKSNQNTILLFANPEDSCQPVIGFVTFPNNPEVTLTPTQLNEGGISALASNPEYDFDLQLIDQQNSENSSYLLYQINQNQCSQPGYFTSYAYVEPSTKGIVYVYFIALAQDFIDLGGPGLPLVIFAEVPPEALIALQQGSGEQPATIATISEATKKQIIYNQDSGWCHIAEPGC